VVIQTLQAGSIPQESCEEEARPVAIKATYGGYPVLLEAGRKRVAGRPVSRVWFELESVGTATSVGSSGKNVETAG
jgi:hypothetical protein